MERTSKAPSKPSTVAMIGTRYGDLDIERSELADLADVVAVPGMSADEIVARAVDADVVIAGSGPRFERQVLERLNCRAIVRSGVGLDSIDLATAECLGYWVVNVPDYGTETVAWHAITLIAAAMRSLLKADSKVRSGQWGIDDLRPLHAPSATTLGVVGYGRIGRKVGELAGAMGFGRILAYDPVVSAADGQVELVALDTLLRESDAVTLHAPGTDGKAILDAGGLSMLKPGSILVNTSRGSLVDLDALVNSLQIGRLTMAALDVFGGEPPDPELFREVGDRVILTPHMAWYSEESEEGLRRESALEARRLLLGEEPLNAVVRPRGK